MRDIRTGIEAGGVTHPLDALRTAGNGADGAIGDGGIADSFARPDAIHMHVDIVRADGTPESIAVPADLALIGEAYGWLQDVRPLVTADSDLAPEELARLLNAGFFSPSDDADADSWETQHTRFEEEALHMALKLLCSDDEARRQSIANAVWREILWLMPRGREVGITVRDRKVSVELGPVALSRRLNSKPDGLAFPCRLSNPPIRPAASNITAGRSFSPSPVEKETDRARHPIRNHAIFASRESRPAAHYPSHGPTPRRQPFAHVLSFPQAPLSWLLQLPPTAEPGITGISISGRCVFASTTDDPTTIPLSATGRTWSGICAAGALPAGPIRR